MRKVWFAFAALQFTDSGMHCSQCGHAPDIVIVDGVSSGFSNRHLQNKIQPPTAATGPSVDHVNPIVLRFFDGPSLGISAKESSTFQESIANWLKVGGSYLLPPLEGEIGAIMRSTTFDARVAGFVDLIWQLNVHQPTHRLSKACKELLKQVNTMSIMMLRLKKTIAGLYQGCSLSYFAA